MISQPGFGTLLTVLMGPSVALPAPPLVTEAIESVDVVHRDSGPSGFNLTLVSGRSGPLGLMDHPLLTLPLLEPFTRVVLVLTLGGVPRVLSDGVIIHRELAPSDSPGETRIRVTGEDLGVLMDLEEKKVEHPAQDETIIATKILLSYAVHGIIPQVTPPLMIDPPLVTDRIPVQQGTDRRYLEQLAGRHGYVFFLRPGPAPMTSTAVWGPPPRLSVPQRAITVGASPHANATISGFRSDALRPVQVAGTVQDRYSNQQLPVRTVAPLRPPLAAMPAWAVNQPDVRTKQLDASGPSITGAFARAQGETDVASDVVVASGTLDSARYGSLLEARGLVGVRGAGYRHDGLWYVREVTHSIGRGTYTQSFTLTREGDGATTPAVVP